MKYLLSLTALALYAIASTGCVNVESDEPATTRSTTVSPGNASVTSTTTTY